MSLLFMLIALAAPRAAAPATCPDEPCALALGGLDEVDGLDAIDARPFGWIRADLALARAHAAAGEPELALELARAAHFSLRARADEVVAARGSGYLLAMHHGLSTLLVALGDAPPELPALGG